MMAPKSLSRMLALGDMLPCRLKEIGLGGLR